MYQKKRDIEELLDLLEKQPALTRCVQIDSESNICEMKAEISSSLIDAALGVGGNGTADDLESAAFMTEISWTNADGETSASATIPTQILNNVFRAGDAAAGVNPGGDWAALMVVRMAWADYCALENKADDVIYVCPDAPREIEEHNADKAAHPALVQALTEMIQTLLGDVQLDDETASRILAELSELRAAASAASAATADVRTAMNTDFAKFEAGTSTSETGAKHGKALLASQSAEDGGFYVGGNKSATRAWTRYLTRYQRTRVRAYGAADSTPEDFYLRADEAGEGNAGNVIARMKDIPAAGDTVTIGEGKDLNISGTLRWRDDDGNTAISARFTDSPSGGVLGQGSASSSAAMTWMSSNYLAWYSATFLRIYAGDNVAAPTAKVEVNPSGVILAAGANDAAKIVIDAGKIQVTGAPLTLNSEPTDAKHAATKGYVDEKVAALEAKLAALEAKITPTEGA